MRTLRRPRRTPRRAAPRRGKLRRIGAAVLLVALPGASDASAAAKQRADLVVAAGKAGVAAGRLGVEFRVKNAGVATAKRSELAVATVVAGKVVVLAKTTVPGVRGGRSHAQTVKRIKLPRALATGTHEISVCADHGDVIAEKSERNNCLDLGTYAGGAITPSVNPKPISLPADAPRAPRPSDPSTTPVPVTDPQPAPTLPSSPAPTPVSSPAPTPVSTVPTNPVPRHTGDVYAVDGMWVYVPDTYDATNLTPIRLLVWMHGCGGVSQYELWDATAGPNQDYIGMAPSGTDGGCWDVNASPASVLAQIATLQTHFNIDRRRIVLGGYSSGGDMAYRMGLEQPTRFAGLLVTNTTPFRDSGATLAGAAAAARKLPIVHLAHRQDTTYPISTVRAETDQLISSGFPLTRIEVDGTHYDDAGAVVNGHAVPGTSADVGVHLLPSMDEDWLAP